MAIIDVQGGEYQDFISALDQAVDGDTVRLTRNIPEYEEPYILSQSNLTLDGNGCIIGGGGGGGGNRVRYIFSGMDGSNLVRGLTVKDLTVYFEQERGRDSADDAAFEGPKTYWGAIVPFGEDCSFINVNVFGNFTVSYLVTSDYLTDKDIVVGGIAGSLTGSCLFDRCRFIGDESYTPNIQVRIREVEVDWEMDAPTPSKSPVSTAFTTAVGGLLGRYTGPSLTMRYCSDVTLNAQANDSEITGFMNVGGIVGEVIGTGAPGCLLDHCVSGAGVLASFRAVGGIAGRVVNTILKDCRVDCNKEENECGREIGLYAYELYVVPPPVIDPEYSVFNRPAYWACVGGVVGSVTDSIVFNCSCGYCIHNERMLKDRDGNFYMAAKGCGGIVGCAESTGGGIYNASIVFCTSHAGVLAEELWHYIGGIAGWIGGVAGKPAIVSRCLMRGNLYSLAYMATGVSGIVGGAASCFTIEYNRVCRPGEVEEESSGSLNGITNIGLALGELLAGASGSGSGSDGMMYIIDNAVSTGSITVYGKPEDDLDGAQPHAHRIVGYIPPKSVMDAGGGTLLLKNNYAGFTISLSGNNTDIKEYELNGYTNDSGIEYDENEIATSAEYISVNPRGDRLDPLTDPAYGVNRANGGNMPLAYMNDKTKIDCQNVASLSLCGDVGAVEPLLRVKRAGGSARSSRKGSSACADDVKDTMRGVIDSIADMENAVNGFIGPLMPGWTNAAGFTGPIDDILAYNRLIGDDLEFAGNVNSSLQNSICCAISYIKCCECGGEERPKSVCLVSYSKATGDSLQGFTYTLTKEGADPPVSVTLTSGSDGTMQFDDLQPGIYHIASAGEGYPDFHTYDLTIEPNGSASLVQTSPDVDPWINANALEECN
ncbi:MAG: prealbumin-like fold domain-containing protein [Oscillospiraceae bacterium]|jgi:hypothetical protein|nr:prealbumin-like fold domain-containing protein [Oscillospiraceae bacterium]